MTKAGWNLGVEHWKNDRPDFLTRCRRETAGQTNWFGWSSNRTVGTVSTTLHENGRASLDFGNCWEGGKVKVYLNDRVVASAGAYTPSQTAMFDFQDGDMLKLRDEGYGAVIVINQITFSCSLG